MFRWIVIGAAVIIPAVFLFLNRSGVDKEDLAAFQKIIARERIARLDSELKKHQAQFAEYAQSLQAQLKLKEQAETELKNAENIALPVYREKPLEKDPTPPLPKKFSNASAAENARILRDEMEGWKQQLQSKNEERRQIALRNQKLDEAHSKKVFYYKNGKRHERRKLDSWDYNKQKTELKLQLEAIQKEIVRLNWRIAEGYKQLRNLNNQQSQQENAFSEKQRTAQIKNRIIVQKNADAKKQFELASAEKQQKIASAREKIQKITLAIQAAGSKQEAIRQAAELCGRKLLKEKDGLADKAGLVHACIISDALGGRKVSREFLKAVRKSGAESRETLKLYLGINAPDVAAVLNSRDFRKKRGAFARSMQMEIRDGMLVFEKEETLETAWKLLKEKYQ